MNAIKFRYWRRTATPNTDIALHRQEATYLSVKCQWSLSCFRAFCTTTRIRLGHPHTRWLRLTLRFIIWSVRPFSKTKNTGEFRQFSVVDGYSVLFQNRSEKVECTRKDTNLDRRKHKLGFGPPIKDCLDLTNLTIFLFTHPSLNNKWLYKQRDWTFIATILGCFQCSTVFIVLSFSKPIFQAGEAYRKNTCWYRWEIQRFVF